MILGRELALFTKATYSNFSESIADASNEINVKTT